MLNQLIVLQMVRVYDYILGGVPGGDIKNVSYSSNNDYDYMTYKLTANKKYSIFFQVFTDAGAVNVSRTKLLCKMTFSMHIAHVLNDSLNTCTNSHL